MAISDVLLEKITQNTCILYFKFVNIYIVKSFTWYKMCQKCWLETLESPNYMYYVSKIQNWINVSSFFHKKYYVKNQDPRFCCMA